MKKFSFSRLVPQVKECVRLFPIETVAGLLFFVLHCVNWGRDWKDARELNAFQAFFPMIIVAIYCCNYFFKAKLRALYYLSLPVLIAPLIIFYHNLGEIVDSPRYAYTLLLTVFVFIAHRRASDNRVFSLNTVRMVTNAVLSGVTGGLLSVAVMLISMSVDYIFDISTDDVISHTGFAVLYIVIPLVFCYMQYREDRYGAESGQLSRFMQIVLNYILNPAIVIYTAILFIYFITIAERWELPKGDVAYMVLAFIIASFAGQMSQLVVTKPLFRWFYRYFTWIAIPPLCLFWIGVIYRIQAYGFTEARVYLSAAGVLMTAFVFFLLVKRLHNYRLMLLVSSAAIVLLTYIPGISAKSMGIRSQENRVRELASTLNLLGSNGKLINTEKFTASNEQQVADALQLDAAYSYVVDNAGIDNAKLTLGTNALNIAKIKTLDKNSNEPYSTWFEFPQSLSIDISGYSKVYTNVTLDDNGSFKVDGRTIVTVPSGYLSRYRETFLKWDSEKIDNDSIRDVRPFIYRNDSCMVVMKSIYYSDDERKSKPDSDVTVFVR